MSKLKISVMLTTLIIAFVISLSSYQSPYKEVDKIIIKQLESKKTKLKVKQYTKDFNKAWKSSRKGLINNRKVFKKNFRNYHVSDDDILLINKNYFRLLDSIDTKKADIRYRINHLVLTNEWTSIKDVYAKKQTNTEMIDELNTLALTIKSSKQISQTKNKIIKLSIDQAKTEKIDLALDKFIDEVVASIYDHKDLLNKKQLFPFDENYSLDELKNEYIAYRTFEQNLHISFCYLRDALIKELDEKSWRKASKILLKLI